ncbi:hypothetical protein TVAG_383780 [Trichomonas vaginalis G3]|uniref:RING-type domain-containing protein n=1 Tax=Trichomonas vaginalis (strain ATCC PRA-98 / G3) TaxID=412133 RepID=A2GCC8_TRIV3|nr:protein ubiquitination [Trichomonas vaginalis G3]EAX85189.1 hypothetical protein TVAG_383780 [Trichomonas vaginalis G3]KAI5483742.1 protein ubiquitination [Trichomonas vaginalis G3]|eukprot:XP_001298119.1 hypothetical protein [Trichomonas vaginalis G3]
MLKQQFFKYLLLYSLYYHKETPLHLAVQENKLDIINLLLENKADPNIRNFDGENVIFTAIRWSHPDLIELLIQNKADPNMYNKKSLSPLHVCVEYKAEAEARTLMLHGANPRYQDSQGKTPFHVAVQNRDTEMSKLFLECGDDLALIRDNNLKTVWDSCPAEFKNTVIPVEIPQPEDNSNKKEKPAEDEMQWLKDKKCCMCKNMDAERILLPCRHCVLCNNCTPKFLEQYFQCPVCKMAIFAAAKQ